MNGTNDNSHVKNETKFNIPIVIDKSETSSGITLLALWSTMSDKSYRVVWPKDRLRPLIEESIIALYTKQGHGEVVLNSDKVIQLEASTVMFLHPKDIKSYQCKGFIWEVFLMEFIPNGAINLPYQHLITLSNNEFFYQEMNQIIEYFQSNQPVERHFATAALTKTIYHWLTLAKVRDQDEKLNLVQEVITKIHLNITQKWQVKDMAESAGCSEQYLRKLFLKYTNQTPKEYYLNSRLNTSRVLLKHKGYTINQTASALNFYDAFHFSKAFKEKFGYPPSKIMKK
ncbi:helix-turn-helix transcriptional regulator [Vibrio litoralis]|uniref:helix-turn-helix transcriptional regulator n=2 Tax=Vibrio litoralis TaxID=335972 RepID=UPI0003FBD8F6|nr:helix-turn-helix transcriptional regulator [Vibrio litoralis]